MAGECGGALEVFDMAFMRRISETSTSAVGLALWLPILSHHTPGYIYNNGVRFVQTWGLFIAQLTIAKESAKSEL
jgi:hypothetical protein